MVHLLSLHKGTDLWAEARLKDRVLQEAKEVLKGKGSSNSNKTLKFTLPSEGQTALEGLLRTNGECAKALLSSAISTNGKEQTDKDLLLVYDLKLLTNKVV